jgi:hypothetical protein
MQERLRTVPYSMFNRGEIITRIIEKLSCCDGFEFKDCCRCESGSN